MKQVFAAILLLLITFFSFRINSFFSSSAHLVIEYSACTTESENVPEGYPCESNESENSKETNAADDDNFSLSHNTFFFPDLSSVNKHRDISFYLSQYYIRINPPPEFSIS